jgi:hypothetical protein
LRENTCPLESRPWSLGGYVSDIADILKRKGITAEMAAETVVEDQGLLLHLLGPFSSETTRVRFNTDRTLTLISRESREVLFPTIGVYTLVSQPYRS